MEKCDDRVIQLLVNKGHHFTFYTMKSLLKRNMSYETLKVAWKSFYSTRVGNGQELLIKEFFDAINNKIFPEFTHKVRLFIMMAWKYDKNSYFSLLPKELILEILEYPGIDEPPYWEFIDFIVNNTKGRDREYHYDLNQLSVPNLEKLIRLVWKRWTVSSYSPLIHQILEILYRKQYTLLSQDAVDSLLFWTKQFLQRIPDQPPLTDYWLLDNLTHYCLTTPNDMTLSIFKLMLQKKLTNKSALSGISHSVPGMYQPIISENKPILELLISNDLFEEQLPQSNYGVTSLVELFQKYPEKVHMLEFIEKCKAQKAKNNTK